MSYIYLYLKDIAKTLVLSIVLIIKLILLLLKRGILINRIILSKNKDNVVVIGNGPSLNKDFDFIKSSQKTCDFISVNHFAEYDLFFLIKPKMHILLDSYFWSDDAHPELVKKRNILFSYLNKVNWKLELILPHNSNVNKIINNINNKMIIVNAIKYIDISNFSMSISRKVVAKLYKTKLVTPPSCNVLIFAIYFALLSKYKKIYVVGADLSFHTDVKVDQLNNDVLIEYKHFYSTSEPVIMYKNPERIDKINMLDIMKDTYYTYYAHSTLNDFANQNDMIIVNKSSYSLIDTYKRFD